MEVLIIGNGFDLAHKLPTTYKDFLEFGKMARRIYTYQNSTSPLVYQQECIDGWDMNIMVKSLLRDAFDKRECKTKMLDKGMGDTEVSTPNESLNELYTLIKSNLWFDYFLKCPSFVGENWIDFESEISRIIQVFDEIRNRLTNEESFQDFNKQKSAVIMSILDAAKGKLSDVTRDTELFDKFLSRMEKELNQLIRALEIYLVDFVGKISVTKKVPEIEKLNPDHILSFNYTVTYQRIYGCEKNIEYSYIHGESKITNTVESNNMVLGIDEYLEDDRKDKEFTFLSFKKFYQRLLKATDKNYLDWVDVIKDGYQEYLKKESDAYAGIVSSLKNGSFNEFPFQKSIRTDMSDIVCPEHSLYIFGHSLDVTDKDILKLFICNDNVQTKIFYYRKNENDKSGLGKLITNLISIMGQDELARRTGGVHKTIELIPQTIEK